MRGFAEEMLYNFILLTGFVVFAAGALPGMKVLFVKLHLAGPAQLVAGS